MGRWWIIGDYSVIPKGPYHRDADESEAEDNVKTVAERLQEETMERALQLEEGTRNQGMQTASGS